MRILPALWDLPLTSGNPEVLSLENWGGDSWFCVFIPVLIIEGLELVQLGHGHCLADLAVKLWSNTTLLS